MKVEHNWVMLWDCPYCKNKGNLGFIYDCPGCGRCRPRGITFYDPEVPREATEAEMKLMGGQDPN